MVAKDKNSTFVPAFSNGAATQVSQSHPHHHVVGNNAQDPKHHHHGKQVIASTLEDWLTSGMIKDDSDESKRNAVQGALPLPQGYKGCTPQNILVHATHTEVIVLPVRIPLAETSVDSQKPWTLYHYCNKISFEKIIRILGKPDLAEELPVLRRTVMNELQADFRERTLHPSPVNPKSEPELIPIEPTKFPAKADILIAVMGKEPHGYSRNGNPLDGFADYCIPFLVPASACMPAHGSCVRICKDTLDLIHRRAEAKHAQEEQHRQEHEARMRMKQQSTQKASTGKSRIWGCLCGSSKQKRPEYLDDDDGGDAGVENKKKEDATKKTSHRELDQWKKHVATEWIKEHFADVQKEKDLEVRRRDEEERVKALQRYQAAQNQAQSVAQERSAKRGIKITVSGEDENMHRTQTSLFDETRLHNPLQVMDHMANAINLHSTAPSMELFHAYKRHEEEDKEIAKAADPRMKQKGTVFATLVHDTGG